MRAGLAGVADRLLALWHHWWLKVIVIFAASRVVTTVIMVAFANAQDRTYWTGPKPDYFAFAAIWDSDWYRIVSIAGYPAQLPIGDDGHVMQNAWAFLPGYPAVVRGFLLIGIPFEYASVIVSVHTTPFISNGV